MKSLLKAVVVAALLLGATLNAVNLPASPQPNRPASPDHLAAVAN